MSLTTFLFHIVFGNLHLIDTNIVLYIIPAMSLTLLFFSFKTMFYKAPKLRKAK